MTRLVSDVVRSAALSPSARLLNLLFPDNCRVCDERLRGFTRIPVCAECLAAPGPFLAEFFCAACRTPFLNSFPLDDEGLCAVCRLGLSGYDAAYAYGEYDGTLRELIHLFKYSRIRPLAAPLGEMISLGIPRDQRFDAVVPVPLHWTRRLRRGFNQSELLARAVAARLGVPVERALRRQRRTPGQAGLTRSMRRRNVVRAFSATRHSAVAGKRLLLVDDVLTTGATAGACAAILKRSGAAHVSVLTLARADRRPLRLEADAGSAKSTVGAM